MKKYNYNRPIIRSQKKINENEEDIEIINNKINDDDDEDDCLNITNAYYRFYDDERENE